MSDTNNKFTSQWFLWGIGTLFYLYQFVVRVAPSVMADDWLLWFSIDTAILGSVVSLFYISYSGMQIPLGLLFDKYGPRVLMSFAALVIALGCLLTLISSSLFLFSAGRLLIGFGSACGFLGTMKIATLCFQEDKIGMLAGLTTAIGTLGGIVGGAPLSLLNDIIGWQGSMGVLALSGVGISILSYICLGYLPKPKKHDFETLAEGFHHLIDGLKILTRSGYAWRVALFAFCMYTPLSAFADIWGVPFFKDIYGYDEFVAASLTGTVFFGVIVGGILLGQILKFFGEYYAMILGALASLTFFALILYVPLPKPALFFCLFGLGVAFAPECVAFSLVYSVLPNDRGGIAVGFTNMVTMASGVLMQPLIGWILELLNPIEDATNTEALSRIHYQISLSTICICLFAACILAYTLRPAHQEQIS